MKLLVASDIHGNLVNFKKVFDFFKLEKLDKMIILGDIFNNNYGLNADGNDISKMLWSIAPYVVTIKGNCDTDFDETIIPTRFENIHEEIIGKNRMVFYHGDRMIMPSSRYRIYAHGHTHQLMLEKRDNIIYLNPGSVGRSRDYSNGSFAVISENEIMILDLDYKILSSIKI